MGGASWRRFIGVLALAFVVRSVGPAFAQGGGTAASISGTVVDSSGAVLPGADVKVKNDGTTAQFTTVTAENGTFAIPGVQPGTYTVTISLMGFKTAVVKPVVLNPMSEMVTV